MATAQLPFAAVGGEPPERVPLDRLEHPEPDPAAGQSPGVTDRLSGRGRSGCAPRARRAGRAHRRAPPRDASMTRSAWSTSKPPSKTASAWSVALLLGRQQVVAPVDRALERALAGGASRGPEPGNGRCAASRSRMAAGGSSDSRAAARARCRAAARRAARRSRRRSAGPGRAPNPAGPPGPGR